MGKSPIKGRVSGSCLYCHAPHSAMAGPATPLWNQQLSVQSYTSYTSSTFHQTGVQPPLGSPTKLCLSCHDGTVAPGQTVAYGKLNMTGSMKTTSKFGGDLRSSHPISMKTPLADSPEINVLLSSASPNTGDATVKLVKGQRRVQHLSRSSRAGQGSDRAGFSGARRFERRPLPRVPRPEPGSERQREFSRWLGGQRPCQGHQHDLESALRRWLWHGGRQRLHQLPHGAQRYRTQLACCAEPTSRLALLATMAAPISIRRHATSSPSSPRPGIHFRPPTICTIAPRAPSLTTTGMPPVWTATIHTPPRPYRLSALLPRFGLLRIRLWESAHRTA